MPAEPSGAPPVRVNEIYERFRGRAPDSATSHMRQRSSYNPPSHEYTKILGSCSHLQGRLLPESSMMERGSNSPVTDGPQDASTRPSTPSSLSQVNRTAPKVSRKTHSKTRTGCGNCKRRKIKVHLAQLSSRYRPLKWHYQGTSFNSAYN